MITLENVSKTFKTKTKNIEALKGVDLHIDKGDIYGIIGYSGAGKSTLVRLINYLEKPDTGNVIVDGQNLKNLSPKKLRQTRKKIGMIFQHFNLLNSVNVFHNIAAPYKNHTELSKKEIKEKVDYLLEVVDLKDKKHAYPHQLSGGQKQRVAIARALANDPDILLCDEATSALDPNTTDSILNLIKKVKEEFKITVVVITHQMEVVKALCNKVAVMEDGKIVENDHLVSVFTKPKTKITRDFIAQSNDKNGIKDKILELKKELYRLSFIGSIADKPIINHFIKTSPVNINILFGNIEKLIDTTFGSLVVELDGEIHEKQLLIQEMESKGVKVEVLPYV
jgi:ABC-type metal ion transport system, ATPase component